MRKRNAGRERQTGRGKASVAGRLRIYALMGVTISILITGFFFAARQHFSSIDYGIRNSRLRKQLDDLETEKRRLIVAREVSVSPAAIKKAVKKLGMFDAEPAALQAAADKRTGTNETVAEKAKADVKGREPGYDIVPVTMTRGAAKDPSPEKVAKKDSPEKDKKNKS